MSMNRRQPLAQFLALPLSFGAVLGLLTACTSGSTPQWMARGYGYQDNSPLSSPVLSSPWDSSITANPEQMGANQAAWQGAAFELVEALSANLAKDGTPLNIRAKSTSPANMALDHYLRQALVKKGYNLTTQPDAGVPLLCAVENGKEKNSYELSAALLDIKGKETSRSAVMAVLPYETE